MLLGFVDEFAISCSMCGGDPERTRETGAASKFTAAGCAATEGLDVDGGSLRFSQWFREPVAAMVPKLRLSVFS